jgi:hypothetical protein
MGQWILDDAQQGHIYGALLLASAHWGKIAKDLAKVQRTEDHVDEELEINRELRRLFNPNPGTEGDDAEDTDGDQMDLDDELEGGVETGGSTKTRVTTPPALTDEQMRDQLLDLGHHVALGSLRGLGKGGRHVIETWMGQVVAAHTGAGTVPDEPLELHDISMPVEAAQAWLAEGPFTVIDRSASDEGPVFDVEDTRDHSVKLTLVDPLDAGLAAARENRNVVRNADLTADEVNTWAFKGPWNVVDLGDGKMQIEAGKEVEKQSDWSFDDACRAAARYNRSIAARADRDEWTEPTPVYVDDDAAQEIKAATEAGFSAEVPSAAGE